MCADVVVHVHLIGQGSKPQLSHRAHVKFAAGQVFCVNASEQRKKDCHRTTKRSGGWLERASFTE